MISRTWLLVRYFSVILSGVALIFSVPYTEPYSLWRWILFIVFSICVILMYILGKCPHCGRRGRHGLSRSPFTAENAGYCNFCGKRVKWKEYADEYIIDDEED